MRNLGLSGIEELLHRSGFVESDPQTMPGLFECPPHHAMELPIIAAYCNILQHSATKQEQFSLTFFQPSAK